MTQPRVSSQNRKLSEVELVEPDSQEMLTAQPPALALQEIEQAGAVLVIVGVGVGPVGVMLGVKDGEGVGVSASGP